MVSTKDIVLEEVRKYEKFVRRSSGVQVIDPSDEGEYEGEWSSSVAVILRNILGEEKKIPKFGFHSRYRGITEEFCDKTSKNPKAIRAIREGE